MAYNSPATVVTGDLITAAKWNADCSANPIAIYAGAMSIASQAIGDLIIATSTTQLGRVADVAVGQVLISGGVGVAPSYSATLPSGMAATNLTLTTPVLGTPQSGALTNCTAFPAASLGGTALPAAVVSSSLTSVGTITSGAWNAGAVTSSGTIAGVAGNFSGLLTVSGFGTHTFSAGGTGGNKLLVRNTTAGTTMFADLEIGNDSDPALAALVAYSSTFTPSTYKAANGVALVTGGAGGLAIVGAGASSDVTIWSRNALAVTFGASQLATFTGAVTIAGVIKTGNTGGVSYITIAETGASTDRSVIYLPNAANGTGNHGGNQIYIGANSSGAGAAGSLRIDNTRSSGTYFLWPDATGDWRTGTANGPTEDNTTVADTSGTVLGDQTSWYARKSNIRPTSMTPSAALARIVDAEISDYEFKSKGYLTPDGKAPYTFTGFVGRQRTDWFLKNVGPQQEPCLNEISILGHYALAFRALNERLAKLETRAH